MKVLVRRFLDEQSFALGVLGAAAMIVGQVLGDGLQTGDIASALVAIGVGLGARRRP